MRRGAALTALAAVAVATEVPFARLWCVIAALSEKTETIQLLATNPSNGMIPKPWALLAQPSGTVPCDLRRGPSRHPSLQAMTKTPADTWCGEGKARASHLLV